MKNHFFGVLFLVICLSGNRAYSQQGFNVTAGIGLPELVNLGVRMQFEQTQLGFAAGTALWEEEENYSISAAFYYHFGGSSEHTQLKPWFVNTGLTYLHYEDEWKREKYWILMPRIGREFNISTKFGIALEGGIMVLVSEHQKVLKERPTSWFDFDLDFSGDVLPSAAVNLFYRF